MNLEALKEPFPAADVSGRELPQFPGYRFGDDGSVWTCRDFRGGCTRPWNKMQPNVDRNGYCRVKLCERGAVSRMLVHRLILLAFDGPPQTDQEAAHKNGKRCDNRSSNLEWKTHAENEHDKVRHGTAQIGDNHSRLKLSSEKVRDIRLRHAGGGVSLQSLGDEFGVTKTTIYRIVKRMIWVNV
jgi:hypothetical protein